MQIAIAPNAFKGSLTAAQAAEAIAQGLEQSALNARLWQWPLADGGDGTLDVLLHEPGAQRYSISVQDPLGRPVAAEYGLLSDGQTAVVEMARASGLALLGDQRAPLRASTYGTGQLMAAAIARGAQRILVGVGGSATIDGGAGALAALGVGLYDSEDRPLALGGGALGTLARVETNPALGDIQIDVLCDVRNPASGPDGAAPIFGPQKGATPEQVSLLAANLAHFFGIIATQTGNDVRETPGTGAAGALAGGLAALAGARLVPGAQTIIETRGYAQALPRCDLVITGEGALDTQTDSGKAPAVIARMAAAHGVPTIAIAGQVPTTLGPTEPFAAVFSPLPRPATNAEAMQHAAEWLAAAAYNLGNTLALGSGLLHRPG
ncbi:MAG: glycerate kinase [Anaerolineales bacterium]